MKKVLALALALVMAFSMSAIAFAEESTVAVEDKQVYCGDCGSVFDTDGALIEHQAKYCETAAVDATAVIEDVVNAIVEIVKANTSMSGDISAVITKLIDFVADIVDGILASESGVNGIVAELEALVADFEIPVLSDLINSLKGLIKDLYAGEIATLPTKPADSPETGSAPVGIAVFAAVSVAAAAAYVCSKKN